MLKRNESNAKKYRNAPPSTCHQAWNIYSAFHLLHLHFFDKPHFLKYTFKNVLIRTFWQFLCICFYQSNDLEAAFEHLDKKQDEIYK